MRSCEIICAHMGRRLGIWVARDFNPVSICCRLCIMPGWPPENAEGDWDADAAGELVSPISVGSGGKDVGITVTTGLLNEGEEWE